MEALPAKVSVCRAVCGLREGDDSVEQMQEGMKEGGPGLGGGQDQQCMPYPNPHLQPVQPYMDFWICTM